MGFHMLGRLAAHALCFWLLYGMLSILLDMLQLREVSAKRALMPAVPELATDMCTGPRGPHVAGRSGMAIWRPGPPGCRSAAVAVAAVSMAVAAAAAGWPCSWESGRCVAAEGRKSSRSAQEAGARTRPCWWSSSCLHQLLTLDRSQGPRPPAAVPPAFAVVRPCEQAQ